MRPVRALILVPTPTGFAWQSSFLGALRAQTCVWGGQSNLPIPLEEGTFDHPALSQIADCLDPDAVIVHAGSWADLEDVYPERLQAELGRIQAALTKRGHRPEAIERFLSELPEQPLTEPWQSEEAERALIARVAPFHHGSHISTSMSSAAWSPGHPFVDALKLARSWLPATVREIRCPLALDAELAIAADTGQLSPTKRRELESIAVSVANPHIIESEWELSSYLHQVARPQQETPPFGIADPGLTWYSQGYDDDPSIRLIVGDSPWDFAVFYALRRLTSVAYWIPANRVLDPIWLGDTRGVGDRLGRGRDVRFRVASVSDPALAAAFADNLAGENDDVAVDVLGWSELMPELPKRHLCTGSVSLPQSLALETSDNQSAYFVTPVPDVRANDDPFGMHWVTEVFVEDWTGIGHPSLGPQLLDAPGYSTYNARPSSDGIAYLSPRALVTATEPLEGQVVRPRLRPLAVEEQVRRALAERGWRCELSDKGIYRAQSEERFGGLTNLIDAVRDPAWHTALLGLTSSKQSGQVGRWLKNEERRIFALSELDTLFRSAHFMEAPADLVRRGILARGLVHKCSQCRWQGWFGQGELGGTLRCGRCRKLLELNEPGWVGRGEPTWQYRLDEVIWQFVVHRGQIGLRAAKEFLWSQRPVTLIGPELDLYRPSRTTPIEIDICVAKGSRLWIGEAKTTVGLGRNRQDARTKVARLRDAAITLDATGVLLVSEPGFNDTARAVIDDVFPQHERLRVLVRQSPAPRIPD
jgi:hypothetical protein